MSTRRQYTTVADTPRNEQETRLAPFLNDRENRNALGVPTESFAVSWKLSNTALYNTWVNNGDWWANARSNLDLILAPAGDIRVLIYAVSNLIQ